MRVPRTSIAGQTTVYAAATGIGGLATAATTALAARLLSPDEFGAYAFAITVLTFTALIFEFGFFVPAARRSAATTPTSARDASEIIGGALVVFVPVGVACIVAVYLFGLWTDAVFAVDAGRA